MVVVNFFGHRGEMLGKLLLFPTRLLSQSNVNSVSVFALPALIFVLGFYSFLIRSSNLLFTHFCKYPHLVTLGAGTDVTRLGVALVTTVVHVPWLRSRGPEPSTDFAPPAAAKAAWDSVLLSCCHRNLAGTWSASSLTAHIYKHASAG
jgi:hypothetical protein